MRYIWECNCGDGINSWSPGALLGRIVFDRGVANFCFGRDGEIFTLNEHPAREDVKGALLSI